MKKILILAGICLFVSCQPMQETIESKQGLIAKNGIVVSAHPLASDVGKSILQKGGNAIDAAIAVQFALAVVYPVAGNIGGGGFMVIRKNDGSTYALDYREKAPGAGSRDMYIGENGEVIQGLSLNGALASGIPGSVDGMAKAFEKFGTLKWSELVQPAIDFAENGYELTEREARGLNRNAESFEKHSTIRPDFILKNEWAAGEKILMKDLAETLMRIRDYGRDGFYKGETAQLIVEEMERGNGIITLEDLANYEAQWRDPIVGNYKNYKMIGMPPPSSGGVALLQLLGMVEGFPLSEWGWNSAKTVHLLVEAERRVYADRAAHLGDPDYYAVPVSNLIDNNYLDSRMQNFNAELATPSDSIKAGSFQVYESTETTHFSIIDSDGNAVSVTTTLNGGYGSNVIVGNAGFLLNNEMDDFSIQPGFPNMYGLIGGEANAIEPGKRMLSSMTPTIVEKDRQLFMVVGTPGGSTIITSVFQTILNVIEFRMGMQEAVSSRRFHHQWRPENVFMESNAITSEDSAMLVKMGHKFLGSGGIGRVDAILVLGEEGLEGGADPRGDDKASGY